LNKPKLEPLGRGKEKVIKDLGVPEGGGPPSSSLKISFNRRGEKEGEKGTSVNTLSPRERGPVISPRKKEI